jgi:acyl-CoA reductase-like NAD-dependent aldehyde dehydrogenase
MKDIFHAFKYIEAGGVVVNDIPTYRADHQPYGGVKNSGLGREGIRYSIEDMTEIKILSVNMKTK